MHWINFLVLAVLLSCCETYKILVIVSLPGKSHGILGDGLVRHLCDAGHEVTFITAFPSKPKKNLKIIDVSENIDAYKGGLLNIKKMMDGENDLQSILALMEIGTEVGRLTLANPRVQNLLKDTSQSFDVIVAEWIFKDVYSGFSAVYDCPYIWFSTLEPHWMVLRLIDEYPSPAYVADSTSNITPPYTFKERVGELINQIYGTFLHYYYIVPLENQYYETYIVPHIRNKNRPIPTVSELKYNASLMLGATHVSLGSATRLPQNYKAVGGFWIDSNVKPLPEDLKKLMDTAEHGVIYFSMGSHLRSQDFPTELIQNILKIFGGLKQTVIWKFEKVLPNTPKNVHIVHWAPQQSILDHPKLRFFISHGGLLSTTEAVHFGVPMICIPAMVDQFVNADRAVRKGFGIRVDLSYSLDADLKRAIDTMLTDPKYAAKAKEVSMIYHDRPVPSGAELVHWVEHVVKTQGASYLRSPALLVPWYQKFYLDLLGVVLTIVFLVFFLISKLCKIMCSKKGNKKKTN